MSDFEAAFQAYMGNNSVVIKKEPMPTYMDTHDVDVENSLTDNLIDIPGSSNSRLTAQGAVATVEDMARIIESILNSAWGSNWGQFANAISVNIETEEIKLPLIIYDTLTRAIAEGTNPKGTLVNTINEIVDGKPTGDALRYYKHLYDCVVEFTIFGNTSAEAEKLMSDFEALIAVTTYILKRKGVSEIVFMKEIPADESSKYTPEIPMKSLLYYVRLEKTSVVKASLLRQIELELEVE